LKDLSSRDVAWMQEFWLARPIDMDLARTRRLNRSLADQAMAAKRLQAYLRRAIDPVGPCIHLARVLMPVLQRNAAVRFYKDFREGTYAAQRLQAAVRMVKLQPRYHQAYSAALDLERWVRVALSLRQYEESLSRSDRAAVAAMTAHGDPSGWGLWERASDFSLSAIPQLLQRSGQFEALQRTLSIAFLSRLIEARGVQAALCVLRFPHFLRRDTVLHRALQFCGHVLDVTFADLCHVCFRFVWVSVAGVEWER